MNLVSSVLSTLLVAVLATGCASTSARNVEQLAPLQQAMGINASSVTPPEYHDIRGAYVLAPAGKALGAGRLWIDIEDRPTKFKGFSPLDAVARAGAGSGTHTIRLKSDAVYTSNGWIYFCEAAAEPSVDSNPCYLVKDFYGNSVDVRAFWTLSATSKKLSKGNILGNHSTINATYTPQEAEQQRQELAARHEAEGTRKAKAQAAERAANIEKAERDEAARKDRLAKSPVGTEDYCRSTFLIPSSEPVEPRTPFKCPVLGRATMEELRANGWEARIVGRLPREGHGEPVYSIELLAVKRR